MAKAEETPCPECGAMTLSIEMKLRAKPIGTFSVAGQQMKFSAVRWPYLVCSSCGLSWPAKDS